jgi:hypothetical protein
MKCKGFAMESFLPENVFKTKQFKEKLISKGNLTFLGSLIIKISKDFMKFTSINHPFIW